MNEQDIEFLQTFFRQVATERPLDPASDRRYVPLYGKDAHGRAMLADDDEDPIERFTRGIQWSSGDSVRLLCGARGVGKSTELRRLQDKLRTAGFHVLLIDMEDFVNMTTPIDISDFLIVIAGGVGEALSTPEMLGKNPIKEGYWGRLVQFLRKTNVKLPNVDVGKLLPTDVKIELKTDPSFRQNIQQHLAGHVGALYRDVCAFFGDCVAALRREHGDAAELVVLVDSIDHIRGTSQNAEAVQSSIETLFVGHPSRLKIPQVHFVYTVPPYLKVRSPKFGSHYGKGTVAMFPLVKVKHKETGEPHEDGIRALARIVRARGDVDRLLGKEHGETLLRNVIVASGGHVRDLLRLFAEITLRAHSIPVEPEAVHGAINQLRWELVPISDENALWLERIATTNDASLGDDHLLPKLAHFLETGLVLCYRNGPEWYDVHPLVRDIVIEQAARIKRTREKPT